MPFWPTLHHCLDEEFDASNTEADYELCRALAAGKAGLHPDAWGNHDPLTTLPPHIRSGYEPPPLPAYLPPVDRKWKDDAKWKAEHRRRPVEEPPKPPKPPRRTPPPARHGEIELTCDECSWRFRLTLHYGHDERPLRAVQLRMLGAQKGWTFIAGCDRCPKCSHIPAPDDIGEGAGEAQSDEQHADGG